MNVLDDLAKRGAKILLDTKTPKHQQVKKQALPVPMTDNRDPHTKFVEKVIKEKPKKQVLLEFFETTIQTEEANL
jgi:hypothetical protein